MDNLIVDFLRSGRFPSKFCQKASGLASTSSIVGVFCWFGVGSVRKFWFGLGWAERAGSVKFEGAGSEGLSLDMGLWLEVHVMQAQSACQARPLGRPLHFMCIHVRHVLHHTPPLPRFRLHTEQLLFCDISRRDV